MRTYKYKLQQHARLSYIINDLLIFSSIVVTVYM